MEEKEKHVFFLGGLTVFNSLSGFVFFSIRDKTRKPKTQKPPKLEQLGVAYWFIDVASATQVYAGLFADASWNTW